MPDRTLGESARPRARRKLTALALTVAVTAPAALAASASADGLEGTRLPEKKLRSLETALLGPKHAGDHASNRRALRRTAKLAKTSAGRRRITMRRSASKARRVEGDPAVVGQWGGAVKIVAEASGAVGINAVMLPTGKVLWFSYSTKLGDKDVGRAVLWNPQDGSFKMVPPPVNPDTGKPANIWCGGASLMSNGHVLVTGGNMDEVVFDTTKAKGLNHVYTFNPFNERWTRHENLRQGRWYPSQVLMPDGRTLIMEGLTADGQNTHNRDIEVFDPNAPLGQEVSVIGTTDGNTPARYQGSPEYYPHLFWTPTGRVLVAGPAKDTFFFTDPMSGFGISGFSTTRRGHTWGSGMLMPLQHDSASGQVMQLGGMDLGAEGPSYPAPEPENQGRWYAIGRPDANLFDERTNTWTYNPQALQVARAHHNTVQLPSGEMVTVGGGIGHVPESPGDAERNGNFSARPEHRQAELYDPASGTWRLAASQAEHRAYHSTAIMLPDGSLVSAGDEGNPVVPNYGINDDDTYEVYKPPYFFKPGRPSLSSTPRQLGYGQGFEVGSPDGDVDRAVLVAPGVTTHSVDMGQRVVNLPVSRSGSGYSVTAPVSANVAPPGWYMLFLVDADGLPSASRWVHLGGTGFNPAAQVADAPQPSGAVASLGSAPPPAQLGAGQPGVARQQQQRPRDTTGPRVYATLVTKRTLDLRRGPLLVRVGLNEAGSARVVVTLTKGKRRVRRLVRFTRTVRVTRARRVTVALQPTRRQRRLLTGRVRVSVAVTARDLAGNTTRKTAARWLR